MTKNEIEDTEQNQLVAEIAYEQVIKNAPREKPLFTAVRNQYFKDPERAIKHETGKEEKLDFGLGAAMLMSPIILAVVEEVVKFITEEVKKAFRDESSSFIHETVRKIFKKPIPASDEKEKVPNLTVEQLKKAHNKAYERALVFLPEKEAEQIADSVVFSILVIG